MFDSESGATSTRSVRLEIGGDDAAYLRGPKRHAVSSPAFRYVDLFAGCGAMSIGVEEALIDAGLRPEIVLAVDNDRAASAVYAANFKAETQHVGAIQDLLEPPGSAVSARERKLAQNGPVDLVMGGPPCQGHSDLNNFSRRNDPKNSLYRYMARAAEVFAPRFLIVENVQGLPHDKSGALDATIHDLERLGYRTNSTLIDVSLIGVPQTRRRHILVASRDEYVDLQVAVQSARQPIRSLSWAIRDLADVTSDTVYDQASKPSIDNRRRIDFLFEHGLYDLPNAERPPCHRDKVQSYNSVYGRLNWDRPSQTITSGFYSMCMGRYVHPERRRTLTAHEAARLQFIPDYFSFASTRSRTAMARMIGNAVPPKLSYFILQTLLGAKATLS